MGPDYNQYNLYLWKDPDVDSSLAEKGPSTKCAPKDERAS